MKIHSHILDVLSDSLREIFLNNRYSDKVIERVFKNHKKWGSRDRKFFAETLYDITRNWRFLWYCLDSNVNFEKNSLKKIFLVYWFLFKKEKIMQFDDLIDARKLSLKIESSEENICIRESFPDWLCDLLAKEVLEYKKIMPVLNQQALVVLRVNRLKTNLISLKKALLSEGIETDMIGPERPDALVLKERKNVFVTDSFKKGFFEVQDGSSQLVAPFMKLESGLRVLDACAGAGGKTLHISSIMANKGKIISMDVEQKKLEQLKVRLKRNGVDCAEVKLIEGTKTIKRYQESFDRVLLDVPCTGIGVLRRNPDTKWKLSFEKYQNLLGLQKKILSEYSTMLKKGGYLIYSTCSILTSENSKQVKEFLTENHNYALDEELTIWPHKTSFDGFYMARMKKN